MVEVELETARLGWGDFRVDTLTGFINFSYDDASVQNGGPFADIQKGVGLFPGDDFMQSVAISDLGPMIIFLPDFDDKFIGFRIIKPYKIQLVGARLTGVPDLIEVWINSHGPAQHQGIKVQLVYPFLYKHGPFKKICLHVDADLFPGVLRDGQNSFADVITAVGNEGELQRASVLF